MKHFSDPNAAIQKHAPLSKGERVMAIVTIALLVAWAVCGWWLR